ncbi:INPP5D [Bugula neritina]|uniref:INPP5D n=1 Tax=Bugula neritina TaxID=10212 RepID=A0A7J7JYI3_BUGNE|nr:INPP5D [Bugula neritina]
MDCPYYHENIDGGEAERRLLQHTGKDGTFLFRDSGSIKGAYILCLLHERKVYQYRVLTDKNKKLFIESVTNRSARQMSTLNELVEFYLSKGISNGLKTSLVRGVRREGMELSDSDDTEDDEAYVDTKYIFGSEKDQPDFIMSTAHQSRQKSVHIYSEPTIDQAPPLGRSPHLQLIRTYHDQLAQADRSKVSPEFVRRVQNYIDRDLLTDVTDISKGESKLSSNHIPKLKSLVVEESVALQRLVLAKVDSKSQFNNLIGQLSQMKQEICSLEMEAVNSYTEAVVRKSKEFAAAESHAEIPPTTFKVTSAVKACAEWTIHAITHSRRK